MGCPPLLTPRPWPQIQGHAGQDTVWGQGRRTSKPQVKQRAESREYESSILRNLRLDTQTRAVHVQFTLYNPNYDLWIPSRCQQIDRSARAESEVEDP